MTDKTIPLPEPAFKLMWKRGAYYVSEPNIGDTDVYTAAQLRTPAAQVARQMVPDERNSAAIGFNACRAATLSAIDAWENSHD